VHNVDATTVDVEVANGVVMTVEKSMVQPAPAASGEEKK
jgi:preprotein translocase subunit YajC